MATINTNQLDKINAQLEGIISYLDNYCALVQEEIDGAGDKAQELINVKMAELSANIQSKADPIRAKIISIFKYQYAKATEKIAPVKTLMDMFPISISLDLSCLTAIYDALVAAKDILIAPYQPVIEFTTQVVPKVLELSSNLQTLASYSPSITLPEGVTMPSLSVTIEPITAGDIMG